MGQLKAKKKEKDLIIIVGNGFDIAHKLPTKYTQFADSYLDDLAKTLIDLKNSMVRGIQLHKLQIHYPIFQRDFVSYLNQIGISNPERYGKIYEYTYPDNVDKLAEYLKRNKKFIRNIIKNGFFGELFYINSSRNPNWFDIENSYFRKLSAVLDIHIRRRTQEFDENDKKSIINLNKSFNEVKSLLREYIIKIDDANEDDQIVNFFNRVPKGYSHHHIINFNFTNTVDKYVKYLPTGTHLVYNVHGLAKDGNIIFGYGNDQNENYQQMKMTEENSFLDHFKTIEYLRDGLYHKLTNAIRSSKSFDVYILGHSLALTDKTLLNEVLNNPNCEDIYIYLKGGIKREMMLRWKDYILNQG